MKDLWLDGYKKHLEEWSKYTATMGRREHDFNGRDNCCLICGAVYDDVINGSAAWSCTKLAECCGKQAIDIWDHTSASFKCSGCGKDKGNLSDYWSNKDSKTPEWVKAKTPDKSKCICNIVTLMQKGCQCGGI